MLDPERPLPVNESIGQGEITRLTICCEWATQDGPRQRYFSLAQLRQYMSWERMNEVLDYLETVCREAQASRDRHEPPERRMRLL
jgi:hypothetical protein